MTLKQRIGRKLIAIGVRWYGVVEAQEEVAEVKQRHRVIHSAVVEATEQPVTWSPEQTGVVVVEPDIMAQFRKEQQRDAEDMSGLQNSSSR